MYIFSKSTELKIANLLYLVYFMVPNWQLKDLVFVIVIAALDEIKKYNPGARDAIKFLEDEIKHGNRCDFFYYVRPWMYAALLNLLEIMYVQKITFQMWLGYGCK